MADALNTSMVLLVWEGFAKLFDELYAEDESKDFKFSFEASAHDASSSLYAHSEIVETYCTNLSPALVQEFHFVNPEIGMPDFECVLDFMYLGEANVETRRLKFVNAAAETIGFKELVIETNYKLLETTAIDLTLNRPDANII